MPKIRGKFTPLFNELAEDYRWLLDCNDQQKLLYICVLITIYECNNVAPDDPRYYKVRYHLRHRLGRVEADLAHIKTMFPKLVCQNKKLSLTNYKGYESRVTHVRGKEIEREIEREGEYSSFDIFWKSYPKKVGKEKAYNVWVKTNPKGPLLEKIMSALEAYKLTEQWSNHNGKYIPYPATWLNQKRWEDEIETDVESPEETIRRLGKQYREQPVR